MWNPRSRTRRGVKSIAPLILRKRDRATITEPAGTAQLAANAYLGSVSVSVVVASGMSGGSKPAA